MALALWLVGAVIVVLFLGTWALQIGLWLLALALRITVWLTTVLLGLVSQAALAVLDPGQLGRILRNERSHARNAALLARERWS
ncbi:hypothetical protein [Brevundimonas lenta]|uniref:Formate hydrogenlyase subunit 4 n=1 Tax=Brevundimonas lenta TaxID=424796 RepID=A0A7W6NQW3_9CAUL|nr:hypothetical protein [Brevundimonas lenta]MBB4083540.1 formate hydrogenlyase subunit 4 [Brevundimonas lenta]